MDFTNAFQYKKWANLELLSAGEKQLHLLPKEDASFFIRILNHTAVVDSLFISRITETQELFSSDNTIETPTIPELRDRMNNNDSWLINFSQTATLSDLERVINFHFTDGDPGQLSIYEIFVHLLTHGSNHRGMASRTLSSKGLERPKDTFTRFLHEVEPERRMAAAITE
ncbi:DinB family protein [Microbulbifer sp. JMSA003]|uniref:DinB family protein n=1 Tax=Microbulbifer sp. JMSA003 TaxID=3243369 RepID=UPI0040396DD3